MSNRPALPAPRSWWGPLWPLGEALRFLTVLPVPGLPPATAEAIPRAIPLFPLAGAVIGALLVGVGLAAGLFWDAWVRATLIVVAWGVITAGLHLDGLSDTFDAVMSWRSRERKLEIMKDSRIGAMGALALIALLALKVAWLHSLGDAWLAAVGLAPVLGRWANMLGIFWFPAAREGGLGRDFQAHVRRGDFWIATGSTLALALLLGGLRGLIALALVAAVAYGLARWWTRALGGLTGDTYGALCEIGEAVALATLAAQLP